jgi:hypothetical protein
VVDNSLSRILSAADDAPPIFEPVNELASNIDVGGGRPNAYALGLVDASQADVSAASSAPVAAAAAAAQVQEIKVAADGTLVLHKATGLEGAWYTVRNFFTITIPGLFTSASTKLRSMFGAATTVTTTDAKSGATSTSTASSSWLLWVFLVGAAAAVFFAVKGKKGGKSILPKLGGKSSVKLR